MATNLYFNNVGSHTEQELINSLTSEVIQVHGMDVYYLPRTLIKEDLILGQFHGFSREISIFYT